MTNWTNNQAIVTRGWTSVAALPGAAGTTSHALHSKHDLVLLACAAAARLMAAPAAGGPAPTRRVRSRGNPAGACPTGPGGDAAPTSADDATATDRTTGSTHDASAPANTGATDGYHTTTTAGAAGHRHATPNTRATHGHDSATTDARPTNGHHTTTPDARATDSHHAAPTDTRPADGHHTTTNTRATDGDYTAATAHGHQSARANGVPIQGRRTRPHAGRLRALGRAQRAGNADRLLGFLVTALCPLRVSGRAGHHR